MLQKQNGLKRNLILRYLVCGNQGIQTGFRDKEIGGENIGPVLLFIGLVKKAGPSGDEEIILNARDRERIGKLLLAAVNADGAKMTISEETRDLTGGLILRRGSIETNCSVELLVELCRGEMSAKLADVLFD